MVPGFKQLVFEEHARNAVFGRLVYELAELAVGRAEVVHVLDDGIVRFRAPLGIAKTLFLRGLGAQLHLYSPTDFIAVDREG